VLASNLFPAYSALLDNDTVIEMPYYSKIPDYSHLMDDDTVVELDPSARSEAGRISIEYLEAMPPVVSWTGKIAWGVSLFSLAIGIVPSAVVCAVLGVITKDSPCIVLALTLGIIGTYFGIAATGTLCCIAYYKARTNENRVLMAQCIRDSYALKNNEQKDSLDAYLADYQDRYGLNNATPKDLAQKIVLANEAGLFAPIEAFLSKLELGDYVKFQDAPKIRSYYKNFTTLKPGVLADEKIQWVVDQLMVIDVNTLSRQRTTLNAVIKKWNADVNEYCQAVEKAISERQMRWQQQMPLQPAVSENGQADEKDQREPLQKPGNEHGQAVEEDMRELEEI